VAVGGFAPHASRRVFIALLSGRRGMIAVLAVAICQVRSLPGDCTLAPASRRRAPASLSRCAIPPGVDTHKGRSWGGRGCVTRHLLPWRGAEFAPRRPAPQRSSSHLARQDHRRIVPSGLNEPQVPVFLRKT
jgi:hypothetical protein